MKLWCKMEIHLHGCSDILYVHMCITAGMEYICKEFCGTSEKRVTDLGICSSPYFLIYLLHVSRVLWHFRETSHGFGNMFITIFLDLSFACFPVFAPEKLILNFNSAVICKIIGNTKTKELFAIHLKLFTKICYPWYTLICLFTLLKLLKTN